MNYSAETILTLILDQQNVINHQNQRIHELTEQLENQDNTPA